MSLPEDRKTVAERYASAMTSGHLEVTDHRGDADYLIAAGWSKDPLGIALYRLRVEFDAAYSHELSDAGPVHAKLMALNRLQSLRPAFAALTAFAELHALRVGFRAPPRRVALIAGTCLDWWLTPNCRHCSGRGFNGGFGSPMVICTHCLSGKRDVRYGPNEEGHQFGRGLLNKMDEMMQNASIHMRRVLRQG